LVSEGSLEEAGRCLNRPFSVLGKVVTGAGRGQSLGFPTANLELMTDIMPPKGVYPVKARIFNFKYEDAGAHKQKLCAAGENIWLEGILNYGVRPTFESRDEGRPEAVPEVFLMDYRGDLYGKVMEVMLFPKIRDEKRFDGSEALQKQIQTDIRQARGYLASLSKKTFTKVSD